MTILSARERYAKFLESPFWKYLSYRKRRMVPRCERCGDHRELQCHHRFYRPDWFETTLDDLEVLCRPCHEKVHRKPQRKKLPVRLTVPAQLLG